MNLVVLVYGCGGDLWNGKLRGAFERLCAKFTSEDARLVLWGVESAKEIKEMDRSSGLIQELLAFDKPSDMEDLNRRLGNGEVRLAVIASANAAHLQNLKQVLDRVPYILVEKPLTDNADSAKAAADLSEAATRSICKGIDHYIAKPSVWKALEWARSGELTERIGDLVDVQFTMCESKLISKHRVEMLDAGLSCDMTIHGAALLGRLLRALDPEGRTLDPNRIEIETAWAGQYAGSPIHGETASRIECSVHGGPHATLAIGKGLLNDKRLVLVGTKATMTVDIAGGTLSVGAFGQEPEVLFEDTTSDAYETLLEQAIRAALSRTEEPQEMAHLIDLQEAANALRLVEEARKHFGEFEQYTPGTMPRGIGSCFDVEGAAVEAYDSREAVERAMLRAILSSSREAIDRSGRFVVVVPGGSSFLGVGKLLADDLTSVDLSNWEIFFTDEHAGLPHASGENNGRLLVEDGGFGVLIESGRLDPGQLHRIVTEEAGEILAEKRLGERLAEYEDAYRALLKTEKGDEAPGADLMILGLGADCHTASIIPSRGGFASPLLNSDRHFDTVAYPEKYGLSAPLRASITPYGIAAAKRVVLLAFGEKKSEAIRDILMGAVDPTMKPGSVIRDVRGTLITDCAGARHLHAA